MNRLSQRALATLAAFGVLLAPVAAQTHGRPAAPAAPRKLDLASAGRGQHRDHEARYQAAGYARSLTTILVKNVSPSPIAGFKVEENWYDKADTPSGGGVYRHARAADAERGDQGRAQDAAQPADEHEPVPVHARQRHGEAEGRAEAGRRAAALRASPLRPPDRRVPRPAALATRRPARRAAPAPARRPRRPPTPRPRTRGRSGRPGSTGRRATALSAPTPDEQHRHRAEQHQRLGGVEPDRCGAAARAAGTARR